MTDPKMPGADDAVAIAKVLGVSAEWLVTGKGPEIIPSRLQDILEDLRVLPPDRLADVARLVHPWAEEARGDHSQTAQVAG